MTELRDARLKRALDSAPDAHMEPAAATRQAVRQAARAAIAPPASVSWWTRLWASTGRQGTPWNAVLATVVLASVVTVLWYDRDVPGVRPDSESGRAAEPVPAAIPQAPASAAPTVAAPAAKAPVAAGARSSKAEATKPEAKSELPDRKRAEAVPAESLRDQAPEPLAKSAAAPPVAEARQADAAIGQSAPMAAPAPMPRAAAPPPPSAAPAAPAAARAERLVLEPWTELRVTAGGRGATVLRRDAERLAVLVDSLARGARSSEPLRAPITARIELARDGQPAGVLELAEPQVRWTPRGVEAQSRTQRLSDEQLQVLREELARLLPR